MRRSKRLSGCAVEILGQEYERIVREVEDQKDKLRQERDRFERGIMELRAEKDKLRQERDRFEREMMELRAEKERAEAEQQRRLEELERRKAENKEELMLHLLCSVCLELPIHSVFLTCGHGFCWLCVQLCKKARRTCPQCR